MSTTNIIIDPVTEDITVYVNEGVAGGVTETGTQTLTNKTLNSPVINTPVIGSAVNWNTTQTIASAGTTDIATASSNVIIVSGTTAITALGTVAAGAERVVTFSGILTLTHNATSLILPGAASITTAAGDVGYFVSLGAGNWRCTGYQKANGTPVVSTGSGLDSVTAATGSATIANGNFPITWNWTQTTASQTGFSLGETAASTNGVGNQYLFNVNTLANSTANPFRVVTRGADTITVSRIGGITITALNGAAGSGSTGSDVTITSGQGTASSGAGGSLSLAAGAGGSTSGNGGNTQLSSGASTVGASGTLSLFTGAGSSGSGSVNISTGSSQSAPGNITVTAGNSTVGSVAGIITLQGGSSRATQSGNSGGIVLNGGAAGAVSSVAGGPVVITAGTGSTTTTGGVGGAVNITAGTGGLAAAGGALTLTSGSGGATGVNGDLTLNLGTNNGTATNAGKLSSNATKIALGGTVSGGSYQTAIGYNGSGGASVASTGNGAMSLGGSYASGANSFAAANVDNTGTYGALGNFSVAIGSSAKTTLAHSYAIGTNALATGSAAFSFGYNCQATGGNSLSLGLNSLAAQFGKFSFAGGSTAAVGDTQYGLLVLRASTTGSTVVMTSDGGAAGVTNQLIVASNQVMAFTGTLIGKQTGSANIAAYEIKGTLVNNAGTVTMPTGTLTLIGTDSIALTTAPTLTADNTNKGLTVTSGAKTATNIRWACTIHSTELTYA